MVYFGLALVGGGILWVLIPRLVDQGQLLISEGPQLIDRGRDLVRRWDPGGDDRLLTSAQQRFDRVGGWVVDVPMTLVSAVRRRTDASVGS